MTKSSDPMRLAFDRELKRRMARGRPLAVAVAASGELQRSFGLPTWEAWETAAAAMNKYGKEPTEAEFKSWVGRANGCRSSPDLRQRQVGAAHLYLTLQALSRWFLGPAGDVLRLMAPVQLRDAIKDLSTHPREELALASALVAALARLADLGTGAQFTLADSQTIHATALLAQPESSAREAGRQHLEGMVAEMERLLAGDLVLPFGLPVDRVVFASLHAMAVNNLAQAWEQSNDGDPIENLRRSIALYERCCNLPQRQAEPEKLLHSLHHLALVRRELAKELADPAERGRLLRLSIEAADRALDLPRQHPGETYPMLEPLRLNRANTEAYWLLHQEETGAIPSAAAREALRHHAATTLDWLATSSIRHRSEGQGAIAFFAQFVDRTELMESSAVAALRELTVRLVPKEPDRRDHRYMTRDEARVALGAMASLTPHGVPSPRVTDDLQIHSCLPILMGALHPHYAGIDNARQLYQLEVIWTRPVLRRLGPLGKKYVDDACEGMHRWMCDPDLPGSYRRVFAGQIAALASLALEPDHGLERLTPLERTRLLDLTGAAFYRAESTFYAQGAANDAPAGTEPSWRISLYRARQELDACATILTYEEFAGLVDRDHKSAIEAALVELRQVQHHGSDGAVETVTITNTAEEIRALREEIGHRCRFGHARGWSPAFVETTPAPSIPDIKVWLGDHPHTAVLLTEGPELALVHADHAGEVALDDLASLAGPDWQPMMDHADKLLHAWGALLMNPADEAQQVADFGAALRNVVHSRAWRAFAGKLVDRLASRGLTTLVLVERGVWRTFPWESLVVGDQRLADAVALVHLPTLARTGAQPAPLREGTLAYVAAPRRAASAALDFGRAAFAATGGAVQEPLGRDDFERACTRVGAVRLFTHATFNTVDAPLSGLGLDETRADDLLYQGYEILTMDLRGCGRVELWACESGVQMDFLGDFLGNDEPLGIASCFLLAGARVVIGSIWKQPAIVAGLIAAAFAAHAGPPGSAERDARALAGAVAAYRNVVAEGGIFETALRAALCDALTQPNPRPDPIPHAFHAAWCAAASHLTGNANIDLPWSTVEPFQANDSLLNEARALADDLEELHHELRRVARHLADELRTDSTTAGWRVLARDKSVL